jgi:TIR domain
MRCWFLSYNSQDLALVQAFQESLRRKDPNAQIFFAPKSLRAGGYWLKQLADEIAKATAFVLLIGEKGLGRWQFDEYCEARDRRVPVVLVLLEGQPAPGLPMLRQLHWIVTAQPASGQTVARVMASTESDATQPPELWRHAAPYRGLAAMTESDMDFFFGRDHETIEVISALAAAQCKIPTLLGNSGVGKSSLAQAGVLAALARQGWPETVGNANAWPQAFNDSRRWCVIKLKPGIEPIRSLFEPFLRIWQFDPTDPNLEPFQEGWIKNLIEGRNTLKGLLNATEDRLQELGQPKPPAFLIYIDQGEELYIRADERHRRRFSDLIAQGIGDPRLYALMSMRSDFLGELQKDAPLYNVRQQIDVPPPREAELRNVVSRPAELLSARFETAELVEIITRRTAEDSVKDVGALPLLSYTLDDMWTQMVRRGDGVLRLPAQSFELGGVLVDRADHFLAAHPKSQDELRRIFTLKLATVREGEEPSRRRAPRREFTDGEWRLVSELADHPNRLLVTATSEGGETFAEIAHEAVFRRWGKLRDWIAIEREFLAWRTGLEAARRAWEATPDVSKTDALLMGAALTQAQSWVAKRRQDMTAIDQDFIALSTKRDSDARARARRSRAVLLVMGSALMLLLFGFGAERYFNWRQGQPWGLLIDLFDGNVFELKGDSISIGRSAGAIKNMIDVSDSQRFVSRLQLFVSRDRRALDARSLNGTTVNARFLPYGYDRQLEDGDIIALAGAAAYQFRVIQPSLLPPWQGPKSSPPAQGAWALLIDGNNRQTTVLMKEAYFLSVGAQGAATLNDEKDAKSLLYIKRPTVAHSDVVVVNLSQDYFLTATIKYEDREYLSLKMPKKTEAPPSLNEQLSRLPRNAAGYISKVTFCFKEAEQSDDVVELPPTDDVSCDVGPLQIVLPSH